MVAINFLPSPRRQTMRITHSQTKDCHRSILAPSLSIYPYVYSPFPSLDIPVRSFSAFLYPTAGYLPLGGVRGTSGPQCVSGPRDPGVPGWRPCGESAEQPRPRREDGADRTGIPGGRPGRGSLKDKSPRFSRSDELLWGKGTELLSPHPSPCFCS